MEEKDKEKILNLFFEKVRSIEEIEKQFNGKYTYKEVRSVIWGRFKENKDVRKS